MPPIIAVIGSADASRSNYPHAIRHFEGALAAAGEIGKELAERGCPIVVFSGSKDYIEHAVVAGYVSSGRAAPRSVQVVGRYGDDTQFAELAPHPHVYTVRPESTDDWEVSFYRSLLSIDGVLLIGGGQSTFIAGLIALSRDIILAPIATFGGAAERVWHRFNAVTKADHVAALAQPWGPGMAATTVDSILAQHSAVQNKRTAEANARQSAGRRATAGLTAALMLLVMAVLMAPVAYAAPAVPWRNVGVLVLAPMLGAASGALARNAYDRSGEWLRATALGCVAGTIAFILYIAGQAATNPTLFSGDGVQRLVWLVLVIGTIGGFTSETVYRRLRDRDVVDAPDRSVAVTN